MAFRDPLYLNLQAGFRHAWVSCHPNPRRLGPRAANPAPPPSIELDARRLAITVRQAPSMIFLVTRAKMLPLGWNLAYMLISH